MYCISMDSNYLTQETKRLITFVQEVSSHMSLFVFTYKEKNFCIAKNIKYFT